MSSALRQTNGAIQGQVLFDKIEANEAKIEFLNQPEHIVFTQAEQALYSNGPRYLRFDQSTQQYKQADGTVINWPDGSWVVLKSLEQLTGDIPIPGNKIKFETLRAFELNLNNYKLIVTGNQSEIIVRTDQDFDNGLEAESDENKRVIKNRGQKNNIKLNQNQVFTGNPHIKMFMSKQQNPYFLPMEPYWYEGYPDVSNTGLCLFRDFWDQMGGDATLQLGPRTNPRDAVAAAWTKVQMFGSPGNFFRQAPVNAASLDPDIHTRQSPSSIGVGTISAYVTDGSNEISGIDQTNITKCSIGNRVYDAGLVIPGPNTTIKKTTIISKIVKNDTNDFSIFLKDSEFPFADIPVTAVGDLTIDGGGNTETSTQLSVNKLHAHDLKIKDDQNTFIGFGDAVTPTATGIPTIQVPTMNIYPASTKKKPYNDSVEWDYRMSVAQNGNSESRSANYQIYPHLIN